MEHYSSIKKNEVLKFSSKLREVEKIVVSVATLAQKGKHCTFSHVDPS